MEEEEVDQEVHHHELEESDGDIGVEEDSFVRGADGNAVAA